jgi:hypothetical protein
MLTKLKSLFGKSERDTTDRLVHERLAKLDEHQAQTIEHLAQETGSPRLAQRARELREDARILRIQIELVEHDSGEGKGE